MNEQEDFDRCARATNKIVNRLYWPAALAERNPRRYYAPHSGAWTTRTNPPRRRGPSLRSAKRLKLTPAPWRPTDGLPF